MSKYKYEYRGLAVIIVNLFKDSKWARLNADHDRVRMLELFSMLDFKVEVHVDKTKSEIEKIMEQAKKWKFKDYDPECFVCVISSHGAEIENKKQKTWEPVFYTAEPNGTMYVKDLATKFSEKCDFYQGKPKLFFIQACRCRDFDNNMFDEGKEIAVKTEGENNGEVENGMKHSDTSDSLSSMGTNEGKREYKLDPDLEEFYTEEDKKAYGWYSDNNTESNADSVRVEGAGDQTDAKGRSGDQSDAKGQPGPSTVAKGGTGVQTAEGMPDTPERGEITLVECPRDFLIMFPVAAGRSAMRSKSEEGSWMFYFMRKLTNSLLKTGSFLPFLTSVANEIASHDFEPEELPDKKKTKCAALIMHRLTTDLVFRPMSDTSVMAHKQKEALKS